MNAMTDILRYGAILFAFLLPLCLHAEEPVQVYVLAGQSK